MADTLEDDYVADGTHAFSDNDESELEFDGAEQQDDQSQEQQAGPSATKKRKRQLEKQRKAKKRKLAEDTASGGVPHSSVAAQAPTILQKYIASSQAKAFDGATVIELQDLAIPEESIEDTSAFANERSLHNLKEFIETATPTLRTRLGQKSKREGAPTLIVITLAAMRGADVVRALRDLRTEKSGQVAKLFAKHFKVNEHVQYLRKTKIVAAVGTPGRLGKLLEADDCLSLDALSHIIIDFTYQDSKKRTIFDIPETRQELFKTVFANDRLKRALQSGKVKLVLF
ncbi:U3-containing 90S pre-ribosomal complex subunit-domain containing protein [Auriculariales sp. MPI-PUGE-AT-0066]|nr:U3-containing 90S pre-ribosomal complex subunit-domain containing protein [Auriculariales sp. MPI-PUGE-AT-0066]